MAVVNRQLKKKNAHLFLVFFFKGLFIFFFTLKILCSKDYYTIIALSEMLLNVVGPFRNEELTKSLFISIGITVMLHYVQYYNWKAAFSYLELLYSMSQKVSKYKVCILHSVF
jgi:hypothetical protein